MAYTTIDNPELYFQTVLWTGNGSSSRSITLDGSEDMQPDWTWIKARAGSEGTQQHYLYDSVRGATKYLQSSTTNVEGTKSNGLSAFASDGFTIGDDNANNGSSTTYVAWNWLAGGSASSNSDGSITSTVSANQTAGFSIVSYTSGQSGVFSIGHGLSSAPKIFIAKSRDSTNNWGFYYTVRGTNTNWMTLDTNDAQGNNNADPDANGIAGGGVGYTGVYAVLNSSTISIGPTAYANSGTSAIGYCFAEVKGFSKFGSYTGNGNADGAFVYTGFRPAFVMTKRTDSTGQWFMHDNKRVTFNVDNKYLAAQDNASEQTFTALDKLASGFKLRTSGTGYNASGGTYIYMAFAESPFVNSNGVPNNAR